MMAEQTQGTEPGRSSDKRISTSSLDEKKKRSQGSFDGKVVRDKKGQQPRKATKVGKADLARDLGIFAGIIVLLLILSLTTLDGVGKDDGKKKSQSIKSTEKALKKSLEERMKADRRNKDALSRGKEYDGCVVFLAESSVPGTGMGLFVTRPFEKGEVVLDEGLLVNMGHRLDDPNDSMDGRNTKSSFSHYALIMKHHPTLANVKVARNIPNDRRTTTTKEEAPREKGVDDQGESMDLSFVASRPIAPGEELFLTVADHPTSSLDMEGNSGGFLFDEIPSSHDYALADDIIQDMLDSLPPMEESGDENNKKKKMKKRKKKFGGVFGTKNKFEPQKPVDRDFLSFVKKTVGRLDKKIANLLPDKDFDLHFRSKKGSALGSLLNHTVYWLEKNGKCMDNIIQRTNATAAIINDDGSMRGGGGAIIAKRLIRKGQLVVPVPFYMTKKQEEFTIWVGGGTNDDNGRTNHHHYCFGHRESSALLCPLSLAVFVNHNRSTTTTTTPDSGDSNQCEEDDGIINARYDWWESSTMDLSSIRLDDLPKISTGDLPVGITATRDIQKGEEILIDSPEVVDGNMIEIPDDIFPLHWRDKKE